jgi:heme iron utilization protein
MNERKDVMLSLKRLMKSRKYAVLATDDQGQPYASLMAFAAMHDGKSVVLAMKRDTRKYRNIRLNGRVALLVDDRENKGSDTQQAVAATVLGEARETEGEERRSLTEVFLLEHPQLRELVESPSSAVVLVTGNMFQVVTRLEDVVEWRA